MRKTMIAALAVALVAPAGANAQDVAADDLSGTWLGSAVQTFPDGATIGFAAMVSFGADGVVVIAYPSDHCGGFLHPSKKGDLTFREEITYGGDVCATGTVTLTPVGDALAYHWENGIDGTAEGTLHRTSKAIPAP